MIKPTPHLYVAAAILLFALFIGAGPLTTGGGSFPTPYTKQSEQKVTNVQDQDVIPAAAATEALIPDLSTRTDGNPFTLRKGGVQRDVKIPLPPAPPLQAPAPPVLPIPRK